MADYTWKCLKCGRAIDEANPSLGVMGLYGCQTCLGSLAHALHVATQPQEDLPEEAAKVLRDNLWVLMD